MWGIELRRDSEVPLKRQIYQALTERILSGTLQGGEALPSTRELASGLRISRNTVNEAYEMLISEGFVLSRQGSPTRVAEGLRLRRDVRTDKGASRPETAPTAWLADFRTGQPDLRQFPRYVWQRLSQNALRGMTPELLGYTGPQGLPALREEIAAWLRRSKGMAVREEDLFITAGATHALHVAADLVSREGREILVEDPCNKGMLQIFLNKGCTIGRISADEQGLRTEELDGRQACAVYVTPSHQFPLGGILPAGRRAALIRFARESDSYIVEDDYDSEIRYYGDPVAPLHAMDPERVIYIGTFSKVLFPGLRIGYAIVPPELQPRWRSLRTHTDVQNPPFEQAVLAEFLRTRKFDRHLGRMRKLYGERRQVLLAAMEEAFGDRWRSWGDAAGLHLAVQFPGRRFDDSFLEACRKRGIRLASVEQHALRKGDHRDKLLFGYGHLEPEEIRGGIRLLKEFMDEGVADS
ncbi:PLP-dependent aminotransferase family protein [Cohnella thailandensis]|uniref:PLP-dependent aminotransferase family protein n=1 Tax=Cohnella thailandensis TaxID=557557 RepID=A0A841SUX7_9BACL|nr:PLP-dependent aminotransferase family protein [Cohnella thailandensis]MBB6635062.1 PLP-dependent aminotransferase family protein [Cohnella thailandensis]MBP1977875.1 GntR family transcriptional regulator/MocR family aminotransferase [Cohnella thailandensis]